MELIKELICTETPQKFNRMNIIFKKWFSFFNVDVVYGIEETLNTLIKKFLKKKFQLRIIDLELYIIDGEYLSFNIKEQLFKNELTLLFKMVNDGDIKVKKTSDLNFENEIIEFENVSNELRTSLCNNLIQFYKKYFELNVKNYILKERVINIVNSVNY